MDEYTQTKSSGASVIGILFAAIVAVIVLVYALFAGGSESPTLDPAAIGTTDEGAPAVQDTSTGESAAPAAGN
ncbi:MAG: hypothetical protein NWQ23_01880 [Yoonia sp.]|uniref:hypothetical protein n=1 Tax=Yoonia sp. TaxID=2212373 RepID=UPI00273D0428|nr:hypothetical protein [Yoonia sp.]MDP5084140.1 hypothetical protein [Yoonia sp.]